MADLQALADALIKGDRNKVAELTKNAIADGTPPKQILEQGLIAGMSVVGRRFKAGVQPLATVVLGTVKGDLHDIGKNLVGMMLTGGGLKVVDIGIDASPEKFVEACKASSAKLCAMSALLTPTMPAMKEIIAAVKASGVPVKTMIGGAPVTQSFADEIGADGYSPDAASAVDLAKSLL